MKIRSNQILFWESSGAEPAHYTVIYCCCPRFTLVQTRHFLYFQRKFTSTTDLVTMKVL